MSRDLRLYRSAGRVWAGCPGKPDAPVRLAWLRPVTGWGKEIALLNGDEEYGIIDNLDSLDEESRRVAREALAASYLVAVITRVVRTSIIFGARCWEVETDRGPRGFAIKNPYTGIRREGDSLFIKDVAGNLFHIPSFSRLDNRSRSLIEKVT